MADFRQLGIVWTIRHADSRQPARPVSQPLHRNKVHDRFPLKSGQFSEVIYRAASGQQTARSGLLRRKKKPAETGS